MNRYILHTQKHITTFINPLCNRWKHHTPRCLNASLLYTPTVLYNILEIFKSCPPLAQQPLVGQGLLITVASWWHSDAPHCRRTTLDKWSAQRKDPYLTTQHSQETDIHASGGIQTHNPSKQTAADPCLTLRDQWDRPKCLNIVRICMPQLVEALCYKPEGLGLIPDGVIGIFHWHNPCGRTVALGSTGPLTETTRNISWGVKVASADCLEIWGPQPPGTLWACPGL
jgi:hypothetical protein